MDAAQTLIAGHIAASLGFPREAYVARVEHYVARPSALPVLRSTEARRGLVAEAFERIRQLVIGATTVDGLVAVAQSLEPFFARYEAVQEQITPDAAELFAFHHARVLRVPVVAS